MFPKEVEITEGESSQEENINELLKENSSEEN